VAENYNARQKKLEEDHVYRWTNNRASGREESIYMYILFAFFT